MSSPSKRAPVEVLAEAIENELKNDKSILFKEKFTLDELKSTDLAAFKSPSSGNLYGDKTFKAALKSLNLHFDITDDTFENPKFKEAQTITAPPAAPIITAPPAAPIITAPPAAPVNIDDVVKEYRGSFEASTTNNWPNPINLDNQVEQFVSGKNIDVSLKPELKQKLIDNLKDLYELSGDQLQLKLAIDKNAFDELKKDAQLSFKPIYYTGAEEKYINNAELKRKAETIKLEDLQQNLKLDTTIPDNKDVPEFIKEVYKQVDAEQFTKARQDVEEKTVKNIKALAENKWSDKPDLDNTIKILTDKVEGEDKKKILKDIVTKKINQFYNITPDGLDLKLKIDEESFNELSDEGKKQFTPIYYRAEHREFPKGVKPKAYAKEAIYFENPDSPITEKEYINNVSLKEKAEITSRESLSDELSRAPNKYLSTMKPGNETIPELIKNIYNEIESKILEETVNNVSNDLKNADFNKLPLEQDLDYLVEVYAKDIVLKKIDERVANHKLNEVNAKALKDIINKGLNEGKSIEEVLASTKTNVHVNVPKIKEEITKKFEQYYNKVSDPEIDFKLKLTVGEKEFDELKLSKANIKEHKEFISYNGHRIDVTGVKGENLRLSMGINEENFNKLKQIEDVEFEPKPYVPFRGHYVNRRTVLNNIELVNKSRLPTRITYDEFGIARPTIDLAEDKVQTKEEIEKEKAGDKAKLLQEILAERNDWKEDKNDNKEFDKFIGQIYTRDLTVKAYIFPPFLLDKAEDSKFIDYLLKNKNYFNELRNIFSTQAKGELVTEWVNSKQVEREDKSKIIEAINEITQIYESYIFYDKEAVNKIKDDKLRKEREKEILNVEKSVKRRLQKSLGDFLFKHELCANEEVIELLDRKLEPEVYKKPEVKKNIKDHLEAMLGLIYEKIGNSSLHLKDLLREIESDGVNNMIIDFNLFDSRQGIFDESNKVVIDFETEGINGIKAFQRAADYANITDVFTMQGDIVKINQKYSDQVNNVLLQAYNYFVKNKSLSGFVRVNSSLELLLNNIDANDKPLLECITKQIIRGLSMGNLIDEDQFVYKNEKGKECVFDPLKYGISLKEIVYQVAKYAGIKDKILLSGRGLKTERKYHDKIKEVVFQAYEHFNKNERKLEGFTYESKTQVRDWNNLASMAKNFESAVNTIDDLDIKISTLQYQRKTDLLARRLDKIESYNKGFESMLDKSYKTLSKKLTAMGTLVKNEAESLGNRLADLESEYVKLNEEYEDFKDADDIINETGAN